MDLVVKEYVRKPSYVMAVQVTEENMEAVSEWCGGFIRGNGQYRHIKVAVHKPMNVQQTKAHVGSWVLKTDAVKDRPKFKVYTNQAFEFSFLPASPDEEKLEEVGSPIGDAVAHELMIDRARNTPDLKQLTEQMFAPPRPSNPTSRELAEGAALRAGTQYNVGPNTGVFARYQAGELNRPLAPVPDLEGDLPAETPIPAPWPMIEQVKMNHSMKTGGITVNQAREIAMMDPEARSKYLENFPLPSDWVPQPEVQPGA